MTLAIGAPHMELNVRLFALYRERAGKNIVTVAVADGATVSDLTDEVRRQIPNLAPPEVKIVVAVNTDYADSEVVLQPGDDVCLIPPVSGG
ncbi:MAG TPA: MoaD/ThiS family protein [Dehalococcoidia bacterium]|nr:MoaD/ThiS family protein [Dehalococcoidia bacterium]|tara:strand:+ start:354 stop:626 length:273 start_codon:yes stop_codon:yes gene_type:complete